jgi:hypothetical protein
MYLNRPEIESPFGDCATMKYFFNNHITMTLPSLSFTQGNSLGLWQCFDGNSLGDAIGNSLQAA